MSTTADIQDVDKLQKVFAEVRSDHAGINRTAWMIVGHVENDPNRVDLLHHDTSPYASLEDLRCHLIDDQVMYCLLRLSSTFDFSTTVKFVYVHWIGDNVPFARKGRFGVVHGSVEKHFNPFHLLIETGNVNDLVEEELLKKLNESSGTSNHVVEGGVRGQQQRGFTAHSVRDQAAVPMRSIAPDSVDVPIADDVSSAIACVRHDTSPTLWLVLGYEDADVGKPLCVVATGDGDVEQLRNHLQDDQVMYALYRTSDTIDNIKVVKFVYIYWIGEKTKPLSKGKVSAHVAPVQKLLSPVHASFSFSNKYELEESVIRDKVMASSGSKSFVMS